MHWDVTSLGTNHCCQNHAPAMLYCQDTLCPLKLPAEGNPPFFHLLLQEGFFFLSLWREKQLIQSAETQWDQSPFRPCWQLICQLRLTEGFQCLSHGEGEHWYRRTSVFFLPEFCVKNPSSWYFSMLLCPEKQFKEVTKWNEALRQTPILYSFLFFKIFN